MSTIEVCIASYNTRMATELTIRSARRQAGVEFRLVVGDGASTDGSLELLRALEAREMLSLQTWSKRVMHKDWLDRWYSTSQADYLVFSDSDVYYRRHGWLRELVEEAEQQGAAIVAGRIQPDWSLRTLWAEGTARTLPGERPEPCLMLLDLRRLRPLVTTSFAYLEEPLAGRPGQKVGYDVGGAFMREARRAGLVCLAMPPSYASAYRHWGGLTWKKGGSGSWKRRLSPRRLAKHVLLQAALVRERLLDRELPGQDGWLRGDR